MKKISNLTVGIVSIKNVCYPVVTICSIAEIIVVYLQKTKMTYHENQFF